jgi:hypothetical protein
LKEVVKKKKKKIKVSYIDMMSYSYVQDSSTSKMKSMKSMTRQEKKNPKDSLIYRKGLVDNGATLSFINEKFAQKLPLNYTLRKFMITLGNGQVCYTKGEVSLDLRLADGMSFKTHL